MKLPELEAPAKISWWGRVAMKTACTYEAILRICPPADLQHVKATAALQIGVTIYQALLFTLIAFSLFASPGEWRPDLVMGALFLSLFMQRIDAFCVIASQWHLNGIEEIKRGGLDIYGGLKARIKAAAFLALRILLSVGLAQLSAIFVSLLVFHDDIAARILAENLHANAHVVAEATALVDGEIRRATDAVTDQTARVAALSKQITAVRQEQIASGASDPQMQQAQQEVTQLLAQKAKAEDGVQSAEAFAADELAGIKRVPGNSGQVGNGPKRRAAEEEIANTKAHAQEIDNRLDAARARLDALRDRLVSANDATKQQSRDQLPVFEKALAGENDKLSALKDQLAAQIRKRNDAIREAVDHSPDHVPLNNGFLARISALEDIAHDDSRIAVIIGLIDVTSFGLEMAAVLATVTSFVPTTYSALIARDAYLRAVNIADEIVRSIDPSVRKMDGIAQTLSRDRPSNDNMDGPWPIGKLGPGEPGNAPQPPKRPRGRPRKYPREDS
jgi:hypothetical protein